MGPPKVHIPLRIDSAPLSHEWRYYMHYVESDNIIYDYELAMLVLIVVS